MRKQLIGLFSGFPDHHFPEEIVARLKVELPVRKSLVFISAWPEEYERNDGDSDGMHAMFEEVGLPFEKHYVIDCRTSPSEAKRLIEEASCIFLMGGNATAQMALIKEKDIADAIKDSDAVLLGVSAGSMNLGKTTIDIWEKMDPYEGLGMANITILSHFDTADEERHEKVLAASKIHPVCAMDDLSAIFVKEGRVDTVGTIHYVEEGNVRLLDADLVKELEQEEYRKVFDIIPDQFDKYRPKYSDELFSSLIDYAKVGPGTRVLEIGPGTGQATDPILRTGCEYHAIELGEHLYRKMKEKYGNFPTFHIVNDDFITHDFGEEKYDLIYSAATIQWIPEEIAYPKILSLLKPGGVLAMMLTSSEYRSNDEALYEKIQKLYDEFFKPDIPYTHGGFRYTAAPEYGYTDVEKREFFGKRTMNAEEYVAFSGTHCTHIVIPEKIREKFFQGLHDAVQDAGGKIVFNDTYILYLTKKPE